jgi:hypothetical protein
MDDMVNISDAAAVPPALWHMLYGAIALGFAIALIWSGIGRLVRARHETGEQERSFSRIIGWAATGLGVLAVIVIAMLGLRTYHSLLS